MVNAQNNWLSRAAASTCLWLLPLTQACIKDGLNQTIMHAKPYPPNPVPNYRALCHSRRTTEEPKSGTGPNRRGRVMKVYSWFRRSLSSSPVMSTHAQDNNKKEATQAAEEEFKELIVVMELRQLLGTSGRICLIGKSGTLRLSSPESSFVMIQAILLPKLSQLRFKLCPRYLKEREFWKIYFMLVRSCLAEYELRAVRLEKLRSMTMENEGSPGKGACEVEMSEAKQAKSTDPATSLEQNMEF
ncbi:hypothetical protein RJ639_010238 [Escallonia herrerae]|uniref:BSD domain-containing protein n=1 Tax=Escallonia herrerae TaxID=1293975 RepID=A0AA89AVV9_9ASTE|nr:hypothetical protein RJ639_010238 [Escallonia herrerae]